MNCEKCKELMWSFLSGDLDKQAVAQVAAHLKNCPACQKEAEKVQEIMDSLSALSEEELPEGYHAELMDKLAGEKNTVHLFPVKKKKYIWKQLSVIAAGVVLVAVVGGTQGILKLRERQEAPLQKLVAQENMETKDKTFDASPKEERSALPKKAVLEEAGDAEEVEVQQKKNTESVPQQKEENTDFKQKETIRPKEEIQGQTPTQTQADMHITENAQTDQGDQTEMIPEENQVQAREFLFSADTEETKGQQQVILSVDTTEGILDRIRDLAISFGGYEEIRLTSETIKILLPSDQAEKFMEGLKKLGETRSMIERSEELEMIAFEITLEIN